MPLIFVFGTGIFVGLLLKDLISAEEGVSSKDEADIRTATQNFLPHAAESLEHAKEQAAAYGADGEASWRDTMARLPGLTEAVTLYFVMRDPTVPKRVKAQIAAALLYLLSPIDVIPDQSGPQGLLDDAGVIYYVFKDLAKHVRRDHFEQATAWLQANGMDPKPWGNLGVPVELVDLMQPTGAPPPPAAIPGPTATP